MGLHPQQQRVDVIGAKGRIDGVERHHGLFLARLVIYARHLRQPRQILPALVALGSALQKQEKFAAAAERFFAALRLEPARTDIKKALLQCLEVIARTLFQQNDFTGAVKAYE